MLKFLINNSSKNIIRPSFKYIIKIQKYQFATTSAEKLNFDHLTQSFKQHQDILVFS